MRNPKGKRPFSDAFSVNCLKQSGRVTRAMTKGVAYMAHTSNENKQRGKTVLVVEDDVSIGELVVLILSTETSYRVLCASNAFQAIDMVKNCIPDLLVLDFHLPRMNGLELYDHLHAQKAFSTIPVLFMSANAPREALQLRHLCSLDKPFEVETLVQTVEGLLAG